MRHLTAEACLAIKQIGSGLIAGGIGSYLIARLLESRLFGVPPFDPWTLAAAAVLLSATALAASLGPALRASRVDAVVTLRNE